MSDVAQHPTFAAEALETERSIAIGHVQKDSRLAAQARHDTQGSFGQIAVWVDQQHRALGLRLHRMVRQAQHQAGFAAPRLGHQQQVPAEDVGW